MGISRKQTGESGDFWKAAESIAREIKDWSEGYKKEIVVSSHGSGFVGHKPTPDANQDPKIGTRQPIQN
jgi:hypothetical protein